MRNHPAVGIIGASICGMFRLVPAVLVCFGSIGLLSLSEAAPLTEARVTKVVNDVKVIDPAKGDHDARPNDVIHDDLALTTGIKSRSELLFQDETLTRLGPESYFSFRSGSRDIILDKGTMLLQVPKGAGGARIHTAAVTAAITGTTIMMEYVPKRHIKVLVLEGSLRLSMNGRFGDSLLLLPGRMVIMSPDAKRIPDPVSVDLRKILHTSKLVNMHKGQGNGGSPLPSMALIEKEIEHQQSAKGSNLLVPTNLVIMGKGTTVSLAPDALLDQLENRDDASDLFASITGQNGAPGTGHGPAPTPLATAAPTPNPNPTPNSNPAASGTPPPPPALPYMATAGTIVHTTTSAPVIVTGKQTQVGAIYKDLNTNGSPSAFLFGSVSSADNQINFDGFYLKNFRPSAVFEFASLNLSGGFTFDTEGGPANVSLVGNSAITGSPGATISLKGINSLLFATTAGDITLPAGANFVTRGDKPGMLAFYARGGNALIGSTFNLPKTSIQITAENDAIVEGSAAFTSSQLTLTGLRNAQFDGQANLSSLFQLTGGAVEFGGTVNVHDAFMFGGSAVVNGTLTAEKFTSAVAGDFTLSMSGGLHLEEGATILAGSNLLLQGVVSTHDLTLIAGTATLDGSIDAGDQLLVLARTIAVNGTLQGNNSDFASSGDFLLGANGTLGNREKITVNSGGGAQFDGTINAPEADLTVRTTGGSIVFNGGISAEHVDLSSTGNAALNQMVSTEELTIHAANISIAGNVSTKLSDLNAAGDFNLTSTGILNLLNNAEIVAGQGITIAGNVQLNDDLTLNAATATTVSGAVAAHTVTFESPALTIVPGGRVTASADVNVTGAASAVLDGNVTAAGNLKLTASSIEIGGSAQASSVTVSTPTLQVNGTLLAQNSLALQLTTGLVAGAAGSIIAAPNVSITVPGPFTFNVADASTTRFDPTNLASLTVSAGSIIFNSDVNVSRTGNLTASNGGIDATGHQLSGFDQISIASGKLVAGGVSANKLIAAPAGSIVIANNLALANSLTAGAVSVGAVVSAPSITVSSITAAGVHANTLTASGTVSLGSADLAPFSGSTLSLTAGNLNFSSDLNFAGLTANLATTNGDIDTAGHQLGGLNNVTIANGSLLTGALSANNLTVSDPGGAAVLKGTIALAGSMKVTAATLDVNGSVTAPVVTLQLSSALNPGSAGSRVAANTLSITTPTAFTFNVTNGSITAFDISNLTRLTIVARSISFTSDLNLPAPLSSLTATAGNIDATGHQLSGFDQITLTNGSLFAAGLSANKLTLTQAGSVNVTNDLQLAQSLTSPGAISAGGVLSSPVISAGSITATGLHTNTLTATGALLINSADLTPFSGSALSLTAGSVTFGANVSLSALTANVTTTAGDINAAGHQLSGFNNLTLTNGNLSANDINAASVHLNQSGTATITGNLTLTGSLTAPSTVTVGGTLTAPSVNAGTVTANGLHTDDTSAVTAITLNSTDLAPIATSTVSLAAPSISFVAGATLNGLAGTPGSSPGNAKNLALDTADFSTTSLVTLNGGDADPGRAEAGGSGGQLSITSSGNVTMSAPISATSGQNSDPTLTGGDGGSVTVTANKTITANDKIEVSSSDGNRRRSAAGGNITLSSRATSGTAIAVNSSAQLLALLDVAAPGPGGTIKFVSSGGAVNVTGATMQADRGTIDVRNTGNTGSVSVSNATLNASTIKVGALGRNGTLNVSGGTISADSIIKLYAGGSNGTVNFTGDVTLNGNSVKTIAGDTVTIFNGKTVTVNGPAPANVFTNNPNYTGWGGNGTTTGTFAGQGATTQPLSGAPGF